jgi:hypothetical protein
MMMRRYFFPACIIIATLISCGSSQKAQQAKDAKENALFNKWLKHSKSELTRAWGPPDSTVTDGKRGEILIYKERVDFKSVMNENYTGTLYSFRKQMYVNADSIIYNWKVWRRK